MLILGGGPAGSATALALRKHAPSLSVLLIEASSFEQPRIGEVLPALAKSLLEYLGAGQFLEEANHLPVYNTLSAWGQSEPAENHSVFSTRGAGWHLDRRSFDAFLNGRAAQSGATILLDTQLESFEQTGEGWTVKLSDDSETNVRLIVDATGRRAFFARKNGAVVRPYDRLISFSQFFTTDKQTAPETIIESFADGWWYTARAGEKRIVSCLTDSDLALSLNLKDRETWLDLLAQTPHIKRSVSGGRLLENENITRPANSALTCLAGGPGWLAVGDAACAFDPLSSQGITKSLRESVFASYAIADLLIKSDPAAIRRHIKFIETEFAAYRELYKKYYTNETRWKERRFWNRRRDEVANYKI